VVRGAGRGGWSWWLFAGGGGGSGGVLGVGWGVRGCAWGGGAVLWLFVCVRGSAALGGGGWAVGRIRVLGLGGPGGRFRGFVLFRGGCRSLA